MLLLRWPSFKDCGRSASADSHYAPGKREMEDTKRWPKVCWYYVKAETVCLGRRGHDRNKHEDFVQHSEWFDTKLRCTSTSNIQIRCSLLVNHKEEHRATVAWMHSSLTTQQWWPTYPHRKVLIDNSDKVVLGPFEPVADTLPFTTSRPLIDKEDVEHLLVWSASRIALTRIRQRVRDTGNFGYHLPDRLGQIERLAKEALKAEEEAEEETA